MTIEMASLTSFVSSLFYSMSITGHFWTCLKRQSQIWTSFTDICALIIIVGGGDSGNSSRRPYAFLVNSSLYVWPDVVNLFDMSYSVTSQSVMDLSDRLPCLFQ